jgi:hypothetical protein
VVASLLASSAQSAPAAAPSEVVPLADPSRCSIHVPPLCQPGRRPISLCESDIVLNRNWIRTS